MTDAVVNEKYYSSEKSLYVRRLSAYARIFFRTAFSKVAVDEGCVFVLSLDVQ